MPEGTEDRNGHRSAIRSGTLGLFVNVDALGPDVRVATGGTDLSNPIYSGKVGYPNPVSAAVGQVGPFAVNLALGGGYEDVGPAIRFFAQLEQNEPIVATQTA